MVEIHTNGHAHTYQQGVKTQWSLYTASKNQNYHNTTALIPEELFQTEFPFVGHYNRWTPSLEMGRGWRSTKDGTCVHCSGNREVAHKMQQKEALRAGAKSRGGNWVGGTYPPICFCGTGEHGSSFKRQNA